MTSTGNIWLVQTDCVPGKEEEFNKWYDEVHVPEVLAVEGVRSVRRFKLASSPEPNGDVRGWLAIYELDGEPAEVEANLAEGRASRARSPYLLNERIITNYYTEVSRA